MSPSRLFTKCMFCFEILTPFLLVLTFTTAAGLQLCISYHRHDCFLSQNFTCFGILPNELTRQRVSVSASVLGSRLVCWGL